MSAAGGAAEARAAAAGPSTLPIVARDVVLVRDGRRVLDGASLTLDGAPLAVMGPNGAGKSLFMRLLHGLIEPDGGSVLWDGAPPDRERRRRQGFVFQRPVLLRRSTAANLDFALRLAGVAKAERAERREALLRRVRLHDRAAVPARRLSGGEQQRLALARVLALRPALLFLDEPTASLDPHSTHAIETIVADEAANGTGVVWVTHDRNQALRVARRVAFMARGRVVETGEARRAIEAPRSEEARAFLEGRLPL